MRSPFKFLDAYTLADRDAFFGREEEIDTLYRMVFQSPLILVYGFSGTGKTSLLQCGLASRFDGPDWLPFFIRRQENINDSFQQALNQLAGGSVEGSIPDKVGNIFKQYLQPLYLIFDQFEELFILGNEEEQETFATSIKTLIAAELPCRIIFVIREEYLGRLYQFEKAIPNLFDFRLRVEPMSTTKVKTVLTSSFEKFNIQLEAPQEVGLQKIIDNISSEKSGIQLPYLQIYLDLLYKTDYKRTYGEKQFTGSYPDLTFTSTEIDELGNIDDVLERFLKEQSDDITLALKVNHKKLPDNLVFSLLDPFVTEDGTKRPIHYVRKGDKIQLQKSAKELFTAVPDSILMKAIELLERRRLLRFTDETIELAHDSLASLIDNKRTDEQRQLNEISKRLKNNYQEHRQTGDYLSERQLVLYEAYLPKLSLNDSIVQFVRASRRHVSAVNNEKRRKQQRFYLAIFVALIAAFAGTFSVYQWRQAKKSEALALRAQELEKEARMKSQQINLNNVLAAGIRIKAEGNLKLAIAYLDTVKQLASNTDLSIPENIDSLKTKWVGLDTLLFKADSLNSSIYTWYDAKELYKRANEIDSSDQIIKLNLELIEEKLEKEYHQRLISIQNLAKSPGIEDCKNINNHLTKLESLRPGDKKVLVWRRWFNDNNTCTGS